MSSEAGFDRLLSGRTGKLDVLELVRVDRAPTTTAASFR